MEVEDTSPIKSSQIKSNQVKSHHIITAYHLLHSLHCIIVYTVSPFQSGHSVNFCPFSIVYRWTELSCLLSAQSFYPLHKDEHR